MGRPRLELVGKTFGRLTVLEESGIDKKKQTLWVCKCSCGSLITTRGSRLQNGGTKSCGCIRTENIRFGKHHERARRKGLAFREVLYQYKENAKRRCIPWELTEEQFKTITSSPCYYTGKLPSSVKKEKYDTYIYNGVDRVDNTKGYTIENCVPCCFIVNAMKRDFSKEKFIETCLKIAERF